MSIDNKIWQPKTKSRKKKCTKKEWQQYRFEPQNYR